jgi:hypothetical protein
MKTHANKLIFIATLSQKWQKVVFRDYDLDFDFTERVNLILEFMLKIWLGKKINERRAKY